MPTGKSVPVTEVEKTSLLNIVLPPDNILDVPGGGEGLSVAHGWVTLLHPLTPTRPETPHTIVIDTDPDDPDNPTITTEIEVTPGL